MAHNWNLTENSQLELQKMIKRRKKIGKMISKEISDDEVYDPLKDVILKISEAPTSSLNRILKSINAMYRSSEPSDTTTRKSLIRQKLSLEKELERRKEEESK